MVSAKRAGALALALLVSLVVASSAAARNFPVQVAGANGKVVLTAKPTRIISLSPAATEMLFAIGAGKQVVAVDERSNYPKRAPKTKLSGFTPNAEAIVSYRPDLVIVVDDLGGIVGALDKLHVPVLVLPTAKRLADSYAQIKTLGRATGRRLAARRLVERMKKQIRAAVRSVPRKHRALTVYHELSPDYYSATSRTYIGRIYKLFGLRNIADAADKTRSGYPQLSGEYVVASNPDLIILVDTRCCDQTAAKVRARPGWDTITAVKNGNVVEANDDIASRWGPRVVSFVRLVAAQVRRLAR